ncbi:MAG TPA: serine/threonine protein kinase [Microvirga sp.]|nr:serine/threonine protein kinase [Microvirga sp.]
MAEPPQAPAEPGGSAGRETVHATCVVIDEAGVLIRGAPGAGKSTLARELVAAAALAGRFARLVSDDRTRLAARHGRLVAEAVGATAGWIEARGVGILSVAHEPRAVVRLLVELSAEEPNRMPTPEEGLATLCGVMVSCIRARSGTPLADLVLFRLREVQGLSDSRFVTAR